MAVPLWITKIAGNAVGGAIGKALGKVAEWVPTPRQHRRKQIRKLEDEIKSIQEKYPNTHDAPAGIRAHYELITHRVSEYKKELIEE